MKKMMLTLAIAISTLSAFAVEEKVSPKVLDAFKNEFNTAKEVEWTVGNTYYMATFTYNDKYVFAYYTADGVLLGLSHYISPAELPMALQNSLKKDYSNFWISDLFEVAKNGKTEYYVTLENADKKIVLQSSGSNEWEEYRKIRKA
jgi:hypothetical protein